MADERTYVYALVLIVGFVALIAMMQVVDFSTNFSSVGNGYNNLQNSNAVQSRHYQLCDKNAVYYDGLCLQISDVYRIVDINDDFQSRICSALDSRPAQELSENQMVVLSTLASTRGCSLYPSTEEGKLFCFGCFKEVNNYGNGANSR